VEEYFQRDGITLVEWADRVRECLPAERIEVSIQVTGHESRRFEVSAHGDALAEVIRRLGGRLGRS